MARLAILADIHGNLPALEAVITDLARLAPDHVYVAGDLVNRCPWSSEVVDIVRAQNWTVIQGNHDLIVGTLDLADPAWPFGNRDRFPELWWTLDHLRPEQRTYLSQLPAAHRIALPNLPPIRLVHGIPGDPFRGFEPGATATNRARLGNVQEPYVVAGHIHLPMHDTVDHTQILNPGGLGISHNGDPRAHYLVLTGSAQGWTPDFRVLDYPRERVHRAFFDTGFMEFAGPMGELHLRTLSTGHAWASDFNFWMRDQPPHVHADIELAVKTYLDSFPDEKQWAFPVGIG